jgi:hypothetical protein
MAGVATLTADAADTAMAGVADMAAALLLQAAGTAADTAVQDKPLTAAVAATAADPIPDAA